MGVIAQAETQASVDDPQGDEGSTKSDMGNCPNAGFAFTNIHHVVKLTQQGLDGEKDDDNNTDDWMVIVNLKKSSSANVVSFVQNHPLLLLQEVYKPVVPV